MNNNLQGSSIDSLKERMYGLEERYKDAARSKLEDPAHTFQFLDM